MKIRAQRGGFEESMQTVAQIENTPEAVKAYLEWQGIVVDGPVESVCYTPDPWKDTHLIIVNGMAAAFCDEPLNGQKEVVTTIEAPRSCPLCGWTLPDEFSGYVGPCPQCVENALAVKEGRPKQTITTPPAAETTIAQALALDEEMKAAAASPKKRYRTVYFISGHKLVHSTGETYTLHCPKAGELGLGDMAMVTMLAKNPRFICQACQQPFGRLSFGSPTPYEEDMQAEVKLSDIVTDLCERSGLDPDSDAISQLDAEQPAQFVPALQQETPTEQQLSTIQVLLPGGRATVSGWQPIGSAPKDGTEFIGAQYWTDGSGGVHWSRYVCWWAEDHSGWDDGGEYCRPAPEFWCALPPGP